MKLFTSEINNKLFKQYPLGNDLDKQKVVSKLFNPYGNGRWFLLNSDPNDPNYLWAIVEMGGEVEIGSVSRNELESIRVTKWGLPLERDLSFSPKNAKEVFEGLLEGKHFAKGGSVADSNKQMLLNQAEGFEHHAEEFESAVKKADEIPAWVVAKSQRASTDLSDITHYLDGENEQKREMKEGEEYAKGGKLDINKIREEYEENEDNNAHSENVVLLAKYFGSESDLRDAKTILAKHEAIGSLPPYLMKERDELSRRLYKKMVEASQDKMAMGGYMAKGGEDRYKLKGNNFGEQIESGQKFKALISKVHENQSGDHKHPENFIKEIAYTGKIVKNDGSNYLKDYSYKGTLTKFEFLDDKDFIEALKYVDRPSIKSFKFEDGGYMANGGIVDPMATVNEIARLSGLRPIAVAEWGDKNNINLVIVLKDLKSKKIKGVDLMTAIVGNPNNKYSKELLA